MVRVKAMIMIVFKVSHPTRGVERYLASWLQAGSGPPAHIRAFRMGARLAKELEYGSSASIIRQPNRPSRSLSGQARRGTAFAGRTYVDGVAERGPQLRSACSLTSSVVVVIAARVHAWDALALAWICASTIQ